MNPCTLFIAVVMIMSGVISKDPGEMHIMESEMSAQQNRIRNKSCGSEVNIVFLKVHKCASSTLSNVIMRYGDSRNLTFILPKKSNLFGHPSERFRPEFAIPTDPSEPPNILCHHTRFSDDIPRIMPNNTLYIAIIKEPTKMFESLYDYFNLGNQYKASFEKFIEEPEKYFRSDVVPPAWNPMMFDFGMEMKDIKNVSKIKTKIAEIEARFDLVLIADYFDESLILLKNLLCWDWEDIISFRLNERTSKQRRNVTVERQRKIRAWNKADVMLYDHFNGIFQRRIDAYGLSKMASDVERLRRITVDRRLQCQGKVTMWNMSIGADKFLDTERDALTRNCIALGAHDYTYTEYLRKKQKVRRTSRIYSVPGKTELMKILLYVG